MRLNRFGSRLVKEVRGVVDGNLVFDEDVLREAGVDDFSRYAVDPEAELQPDLYTPEFRGLG